MSENIYCPYQKKCSLAMWFGKKDCPTGNSPIVNENTYSCFYENRKIPGMNLKTPNRLYTKQLNQNEEILKRLELLLPQNAMGDID